MAWYSLAVRPINMMRGQMVRAASPHTSEWGLKRLLARPATRAATLENLLRRTGQDHDLAAHVLLSDKTSLAEKVSFINALITSPEFQNQIQSFNSSDEMPSPPSFFSWLAGQSQLTIEEIYQLWSRFDHVQPGEHIGLVAMDASPATEGARNAFKVSPNLEVIYSFEYKAGTDARDPRNIIDNTHQIDGYKIGQKEFYLIRQPIKSYKWTRADFFRVFPQTIWNEKLLKDIITEGFFSALEVRQFRAEQKNIDSVQKMFDQNRPLTINIRRSSGSADVEIEITYNTSALP